ncbi:MAG: hypothetical protein IKP06_06360 [Elusimicrobiaceae bacterium]|nr:hypothetical protein [Elusimicrobiaceae bacterium]
MKKALWVVLVSMVAVPALCAQPTLQLEGAIKKAVAQKLMSMQPKKSQPAKREVTKEDVMSQVKALRNMIKNAKEENVSIIMQGVVRVADFFLPYVAAGNGDVRELVYEIETPVKVGWSADGVFVVSKAIDEFTDVLSHEWGSREPTDELMSMNQILKQYPPMTEQEFQAYKAMQRSLGHFRSYVGKSEKENPLMVMQAAVYMADVFFDEYAQNPGEKTDRFVAKNPQLAASVAREINAPIKVGWNANATIKIADYIGSHIYEADKAWKSHAPADELDIFAKFLVKASQEK